jgi:hypothetical protein
MEHEKQMNQILLRLESIVETNPTEKFSTKHTLSNNNQTGLQTNTFTLSFTNPDSFKEVKSLKIEWGEKSKDLDKHEADITMETLLTRAKKTENPTSQL